ncbi:GNAT family N-acetyltransferase [Gracilibacillus alcaliphilus]|uniref:GNAT family N-acetyltransferase n=1 Tax=Gracilibacillus alcaliphilus TaxID=1401441 RepID=UPI001958F335|nr:GNAT family protein [Gracilibacillus alcaliphilus]MBM7675538.1 RimJ/RimL family protein N-acetyltransferase [Gracilibacillus alcaliphilus]
MNQRINKYNQPIGEAMSNWQKRPFPGDMYYVGKYTIITRLSREHSKALYECFTHSHPSNWTYLPEEPPQNYEAFEQMLLNKIASKTEIFYVVLKKETNQPLGIFSLMRIDQENGVIEVGHVNFSDALRKTRISTEAHYLLAVYVFEELQYRRYEWKCDSLNAPSNQTAKRLGFQYEGTFRNNKIYKQRSRNTNWFSMLIEEWPLHKQVIAKWLAEENFDNKGVQIRRLETFKH